ncbi:murein biosynthesis integral membrane protein MurJ [Leifsonia shinshuensis]|uniref:murein biosynthesis integral membrane protein MurJ n=1 Tax=Leifsonia shinshuensis TaxID=150026 RepID=UPI00285CCC9C|nr:murein biosynthesis integral membrane protein MurJ [Leifsonia shinshuensis]MDR6972319.1 putative peptidoglycan lipid II flippase [Leifsonia shinshuensis]
MASVGRASAMLASGTLVSRLLGFAKAWLLVQAIGVVTFAANAYGTATIVPNSIYAIIAQGILNAILVPQIVRASVNADGGRAYINKLVTLGMVVFAAVAVVATFLAPVLVSLFGIPAAQKDLATAFAYWSLPQIFFLGLYTLLGEVLNARKSFGPFTWAPVINNIVAIATLLAFILAFGSAASGRHGSDWSFGMIALLAGGATLGVAVQALILFVFWRRVGLRFRFDFGWRGVDLGTAGKAAGWTFAMLIATQVAGLIETNVSNSAGEGYAGPFAMQNAWLIFMLPHGIIAVSIVTAFYTRMAEHAHRGSITEFREDFSAAARSIMLLIVFSSAALIVTAFPVARVFTSDYQALGLVLIAYLVGLVPFSLVFMAQRAFYSLGDTRTPFFFTLAQVVVIVAGVLLCFLVPPGIRAASVALVVSIASFVQAALAFWLLRRRTGGVDGGRILASLWRFVVAALASIAAGAGFLVILGGVDAGAFPVSGPIAAVVTTAVVGVVMLIVYVGFLVILRSPDLESGLAPILNRAGRRSRAPR